jgi:hypothetical protein
MTSVTSAEVALPGQILQAGFEGKTIQVDHSVDYATVSVTLKSTLKMETKQFFETLDY